MLPFAQAERQGAFIISPVTEGVNFPCYTSAEIFLQLHLPLALDKKMEINQNSIFMDYKTRL